MQDLLEDATDCTTGGQLLPHPADKKYRTLGADLQVVNRPEQEYQIIQQYVKVRPLLLSCCSLGKCQTPFKVCPEAVQVHCGDMADPRSRQALRVQHSPSDGLPRRLSGLRAALAAAPVEERSTQAALEQAASAMVLTQFT